MRITAPLLALCTVLAGCQSASDKYPSLAVRDAERMQGSIAVTVTATTPVETPPPSPELMARLEQMLSSASALHQAFVSSTPRAQSLARAGSGADTSTNVWAAAQVALADLDSQRSQLAVVLGDLDILYADSAVALESREEIGATRSAVVRLVEEEDRVLADLRSIVR